MALIDRSADSRSTFPDKVVALLHEARWLALVAVAALLALALGGFDRADPGWSHAVATESVSNPAGRFGAWLADLMLYLFGYSAWWWVTLMLVIVWWGYRRLDRLRSEPAAGLGKRTLAVLLTGFVLLLLTSTALESLRFHSYGSDLPLASGGMLGMEAGGFALRYFGFTGGTMLLLVLFAAAFSVFFGISWLRAAEKFGTLLELAYFAARGAYERWQDRRIGKVVAQEREAIVEVEKKKVEAHEPIVIAMPEVAVEVSKKVEKRIERERQVPLFIDAVAGGMLPPLHLLDEAAPATDLPTPETLEYTSRLIERKLGDFGVTVKVVAAYPGPVITRYEIEPDTGVKGSQIVNLDRDLARALAVARIRVVETVPGKSCMALELPNSKRQSVRLSEIIASKAYNDMSSPLTLTLGKDIGGQPVVADLAKMPHLLVAGTTGSGKSVGINAMILSLLYKSEPEAVKLILVDPKMLELSVYEGIPHLLAPVVTDMRQAANALNWCVGEMEKRYKLMSSLGVRNLAGCNSKIREAEKAGNKIPNPFSITPESPEPLKTLPHIVVVIDELADLMMVVGKKVEELIARLAQKARAAGIHLILATQRPSVDVITGLIKANIPTRMSFQVSSKIDSRTILDQMGAEALLGQGDMLYLAPGTGYPTRVHGAFVADDEVHRVVEYLKQAGPPEYVEDVLTGGDAEGDGEGGEGGDGDAENDPMYDQAVEIVLKSRRASISLVQRNLRIGYNRASRLIEAMEKAGLVSAMDGRGGREVIAPARTE